MKRSDCLVGASPGKGLQFVGHMPPVSVESCCAAATGIDAGAPVSAARWGGSCTSGISAGCQRGPGLLFRGAAWRALHVEDMSCWALNPPERPAGQRGPKLLARLFSN